MFLMHENELENKEVSQRGGETSFGRNFMFKEGVKN